MITFDLTKLEIAAEQIAIEALENTPFWPAVVDLANQGMKPEQARRELLKLLNNWSGHAQYVELTKDICLKFWRFSPTLASRIKSHSRS